MPTEPDHYEVLQISPNAEPGVILAAYRRLAQTYQVSAAAISSVMMPAIVP